MQNSVDRIIIDTNIWISFLISKDFAKLDQILFSNKATLIFSEELLLEFLEVVKRPKFKRFFSAIEIETILEILDEYAAFVKVNSTVDMCRDSKDNFLLALAIDGKADYLLTGDNDLLDMGKCGETNIISISDYLLYNKTDH